MVKVYPGPRVGTTVPFISFSAPSSTMLKCEKSPSVYMGRRKKQVQ
jgi:hypothetical protein